MPSGFSLQIEGLQELSAYAMQLATTLKPTITTQLTAIFESAASRMKSDCPVRTGRLKESITLKSGGGGTILVQINIPTKYAGFVNFGTSRMRPRPYASNGYNFILSEMKRISAM